MIEVLHLIDTYRIGGPGKTVINSARFIDRARYRVHAGAFTSRDEDRNEFTAAADAAGIPVLRLVERRRIQPGHIGEVRAYLRRERIGVLHTHGYRSDTLGVLATRGLDVALVTTHHGWIRNSRKQALVARVARELTRAFDGVEVVSRPLLDELPAAVVRSGRAEIVHNGIVTGDYEPAGRRAALRALIGAPEGDPLIGVVGRLSLEKGCLEMIEAFAAVAATVPSARLAVVGEGPLGDAVRARVAAAGLEARVHFPGHQRDMRGMYEAIDVLFSPSRTEGISNVILEAMTMGRPVVATRVGGTPEIVEDGVSGLLVPSGASTAMAAAIARVCRDSGLAARLADGGRARIAEHFDFGARMRREEAFYERILATRRAAGQF
jgi:glycosyltransferase involved in cell wall biosynthesis